MTGDHDTITLKDAAQRFGIKQHTLKREAERGRLEVYKIGGRLYTRRSCVEELGRCWYATKNVDHNGSGIYVIGFDDYVKIGWSEDLGRRLRALQLGLPVKLKIYATFQCAKVNEEILLRRFRKYRTRGEWFRHEGSVAAWVKMGCPL